MPDPRLQKPAAAPAPVMGADMAQLFAALAQSMQANTAMASQRLQLQRDLMFGRDRGWSPTSAVQDPFNSGFFKSSAADLTPDQLAQSQGGNAVNQWKFPGKFDWNAPAPGTAAEGAAAASAPTQQIPGPFIPPPLTGPQGNASSDAANLAQNMQLARTSFRAPQPPQLPGAPKPPAMRKGSSFAFGASAAPRRGFSF